MCRRNHRLDPRAPDVWTSLVLLLDASPQWMVASFERVRSNVRASVSDLGMFTLAVGCYAICGGKLHYRCVLVYCVHLLRESCRDHRKIVVEHLRRDSAFRRSSIHRGTTGGSLGRDLLVSVARSQLVNRCGSSFNATSPLDEKTARLLRDPVIRQHPKEPIRAQRL